MTVTALTSREFNQDTGSAKKAARRGPSSSPIAAGRRMFC